MRPLDRNVLGILLLGNFALCAAFLGSHGGRQVQLGALEPQLREIYGAPTLEGYRFGDEVPLPAEYLYLENAAAGPLGSIYMGYYPRQGPFETSPHDPVFCYRSFGWDIERAPAPMEIPAGDDLSAAWLEQMIVRSGDQRRLVCFWLQRGGQLPTRASEVTSWGQDLWDRLRLGRSDLVWVRLELDPDRVSLPLPPEWAHRIRAHIKLVLAMAG